MRCESNRRWQKKWTGKGISFRLKMIKIKYNNHLAFKRGGVGQVCLACKSRNKNWRLSLKMILISAGIFRLQNMDLFTLFSWAVKTWTLRIISNSINFSQSFFFNFLNFFYGLFQFIIYLYFLLLFLNRLETGEMSPTSGHMPLIFIEYFIFVCLWELVSMYYANLLSWNGM